MYCIWTTRFQGIDRVWPNIPRISHMSIKTHIVYKELPKVQMFMIKVFHWDG